MRLGREGGREGRRAAEGVAGRKGQRVGNSAALPQTPQKTPTQQRHERDQRGSARCEHALAPVGLRRGGWCRNGREPAGGEGGAPNGAHRPTGAPASWGAAQGSPFPPLGIRPRARPRPRSPAPAPAAGAAHQVEQRGQVVREGGVALDLGQAPAARVAAAGAARDGAAARARAGAALCGGGRRGGALVVARQLPVLLGARRVARAVAAAARARRRRAGGVR
jgi:hypothetical protein